MQYYSNLNICNNTKYIINTNINTNNNSNNHDNNNKNQCGTTNMCKMNRNGHNVNDKRLIPNETINHKLIDINNCSCCNKSIVLMLCCSIISITIIGISSILNSYYQTFMYGFCLLLMCKDDTDYFLAFDDFWHLITIFSNFDRHKHGTNTKW